MPYRFFEEDSLTIAKTWDYIWNNSAFFEVMSQALYYYQYRQLQSGEFDILINWVDRCQCWEHSDDLSKIYATVVEENPAWMIPTMQHWNQSENPWKRRQSVVGLIEYAHKRKRVLSFSQLISFIDPLLHDSDEYVQKGLGWTLREVYNLYPAETTDYIIQNIHAISPTAYHAATDRLSHERKSQLNRLRSEHRARHRHT